MRPSLPSRSPMRWLQSPPREARPTVRIKPGSTTPYKDSAGNVWMADTGFADGETVSRDDSLQIEGTKDPAMFRNERYLMTKFSYPLPNGKYTVKLYFAETYEGITGPGQRVLLFQCRRAGRERP